jgi:hypothetical protein
MSDEITVEQALKDLREVFPHGGTISVDVGASQFDDGDCLTDCSIVVQRAAVNSAKRWRGDSLTECMANVHAWKRSQI